MANYLQIGQTLQGRYRILSFIKQGGFAALYHAQDLSFLQREVAIKQNFDPAPDVEQAFWLEAELLANLEQVNLPRVTDRFQEPGLGKFLVMTFIEGQDIENIVEHRGPLALAEVIRCFSQICDALTYLHTQPQPIIHRDIKPANIRIRPEGSAFLVDFGIAKIHVPGGRSMMLAVTPGFSPMEQYGSGGTDARSDIYALGATMYFAVTGQAPPDAPARVGNTATLPPPRQFNPQLHLGLEQLILQCMRLEREKRIQSARQVREWLLQLGDPPVIPAELFGRISNAKAGARLVLQNGPLARSSALGTNGAYAFQNLPPGDYGLYLETGQALQSQVTLASGQKLELNYALPRTGISRAVWVGLGALGLGAAGAILFTQFQSVTPPLVPTRIAERTTTSVTVFPTRPSVVPTIVVPPTAVPTQSAPTLIPSTVTPIPFITPSPSPTATPTASVTPSPSPTATETPGPFLDTFAYESNGTLSLEADTLNPGQIQFVTYTGFYKEIELAVSAKGLAGDPGYGLMFGHRDDENYFVYVIDPVEQRWTAWSLDKGEFLSLGDWIFSPAIRTDPQTNQLRVECRAQNFNFYVNGQYLGSRQSGAYLGGEVGMVAYARRAGGLRVEFDDFHLELLR